MCFPLVQLLYVIVIFRSNRCEAYVINNIAEITNLTLVIGCWKLCERLKYQIFIEVSTHVANFIFNSMLLPDIALG